MRGFGYLTSIASVILLGIIAWPRPEEPGWHLPALLAGMALSIFGMGLRWLASRQEKGEMKAVERQVGVTHPAE